MFGSHLSIAGGMVNALNEAERLNMDCVQVFTKNQRQWRVRPLSDSECNDWLTKLRAMNWDRATGPARVVSHNSYLINMASPDPTMWKRSVEVQRVEIERCEQLRIPLCVAHPGAHLGKPRTPGEPNRLGEPPSKDELAGLARIVTALDAIHRDLPGYRTVTCLETTVGSGTNLGYDFQHLAWIRERVKEPQRVQFCFDTCHITAAGYDMSSDASAKQTLREWDKVCGYSNLRVFHLNDSVGGIGSRRDRHAHINEGQCGRSCFQTIVNRRRFARVPMILETPKGMNEQGLEWDRVNIRRLRRLIRRP